MLTIWHLWSIESSFTGMNNLLICRNCESTKKAKLKSFQFYVRFLIFMHLVLKVLRVIDQTWKALVHILDWLHLLLLCWSLLPVANVSKTISTAPWRMSPSDSNVPMGLTKWEPPQSWEEMWAFCTLWSKRKTSTGSLSGVHMSRILVRPNTTPGFWSTFNLWGFYIDLEHHSFK